MNEDKFLTMLRRHLRYLPSGHSLGMSDNLKQLGLDSFATIDLLLDIEDNYGVSLSDRILMEGTFSTPQALWGVVQGLVAPHAER